jgi:hypothetical protein
VLLLNLAVLDIWLSQRTVLLFVVRFFAVRAKKEPQMYWPVPCYRRQSSIEAATG